MSGAAIIPAIFVKLFPLLSRVKQCPSFAFDKIAENAGVLSGVGVGVGVAVMFISDPFIYAIKNTFNFI
jgi:hypothetical protein